MFPAYSLPPEPAEPEKPIDPRTAAEDAVVAWIEGASEFAQATMVQQLNVRGWTNEKALRVRQREWRRGT